MSDGLGLDQFKASPLRRPDYLDGDDLADTAEAPVYLIDELIETDAHGIIGGSTGTYKTFFSLRMALSIVSGLPFFGREVFKTGSVLYVCGEGERAVKRRLRALRIKYGVSIDGIKLYNHPVRFTDAESMDRLRQVVEYLDPVLVILDTFASLAGGVDENSPSSVGPCLANIREACEGRSSVIVHHFGKDAAKGFRGASNFLADVDFGFSFESKTKMVATVSCEKMKDGEMFDDFHFGAEVVQLGIFSPQGKESTSLVVVDVAMAELKMLPEKMSEEGKPARTFGYLRNLIMQKQRETGEEFVAVSREEWLAALPGELVGKDNGFFRNSVRRLRDQGVIFDGQDGQFMIEKP